MNEQIKQAYERGFYAELRKFAKNDESHLGRNLALGGAGLAGAGAAGYGYTHPEQLQDLWENVAGRGQDLWENVSDTAKENLTAENLRDLAGRASMNIADWAAQARHGVGGLARQVADEWAPAPEHVLKYVPTASGVMQNAPDYLERAYNAARSLYDPASGFVTDFKNWLDPSYIAQ